MDRQQVTLLNIHISLTLQIISPSFALNHFFIPEREELFSECLDKPGFSYVDELADLSRFNRKKDADGAMNISGNITMLWDVEPSNRVAVSIIYPYNILIGCG